MTLGQQQETFMKDVQSLLEHIHAKGLNARGGELKRTADQQAIYVKKGLSKTSNSNHLKSLAIDLHVFKNGKWLKTKKELQELGDYWEGLNEQNKWGGNYKSFTDCPHFERVAN